MTQRTELLLLQSDDPEELAARVARLADECATAPDRPLANVVAPLTAERVSGRHRLAVVASSVPELERLLRRPVDEAHSRRSPRQLSAAYRGDDGVGDHGRIAWLFPGEGAQYAGMLADLCMHFPEARACFDALDRAIDDGPPPSRAVFPVLPGVEGTGDLWGMGGAVEAVLTANRAVATVLHAVGLDPDVVVGHSTGEYSALLEAGAIDVPDDGALVASLRLGHRISRELEGAGSIPEGALLAVGASDLGIVTAVLGRHTGRAWLALDNCPSQSVVFAAADVADTVTEELRRAGALVQALPFRRAYHTPLFESVGEALAPLSEALPLRTAKREVWSSATASPYPSDPEAIRHVLTGQWSGTVRFRETVLALHGSGVRVFVEAGPRGNLRQFVQDTLRGRPHLTVSADHPATPGLTQLQHLAGALAAAGLAMDLSPLRPPSPPTPGRRAPRLRLGLPTMTLQDAAPPTPRGVESPTVAARPGPVTAPTPISPPRPPRTTWSGEHVFDPARDHWLRDHALGSRVSATDPGLSALIVIPLSVSVELLARAATTLAPGRQVNALRELRANRWLVVDQEPLAIGVVAVRGPGPDDVHVTLAERDRPDSGPVFEGTVELAPAGSQPPTPAGWDALEVPDGRPPTWQPDELYRQGMFHGPTFRTVASLDAIGARGLLATLEVSAEIPGPAPLTSPLHVDGCGQLLGFWTAARLPSGYAVFPFAVERLELPQGPLPTGRPLRAAVRVRQVTEETVRADLEARDADGRPRLLVTGWEDRRVRLPASLLRLRVDPAHELLSEDWPGPVPAGAAVICRRVRLDPRLLDPEAALWLDVLASLVLARSERVMWRRLRGTPRGHGWLAGRIAAKDAVRCSPGGPGLATLPADLAVQVDELGAPYVSVRDGDSPRISISHTGPWAVAVAVQDTPGVGVDIEQLGRAPAGLGEVVVSPAEAEDAGLGPVDGERALRLWCAKEAAAKALGHGLPAGPASLLVQVTDPAASTVELIPGPPLVAVDVSLEGERVSVHTTRDHDLITAIARR